jgi:DNA-3-methyladenine glycosylase
VRAGAKIGRDYFTQDPLACARGLIGCELIWNECAGVIVETEAYAARDDEACHTFFRPSTRAFVAERPPGTAYVYFNYGMYWLLNVLLRGPEDGFVLIRAVEPTRGIPLMQGRRKREDLAALCSGPGKLCQAFGISGADHGRDLCDEKGIGFVHRGGTVDVEQDLRIGITRAAHFPWRFLLRGSRYVSAPSKVAARKAPAEPRTTRK